MSIKDDNILKNESPWGSNPGGGGGGNGNGSGQRRAPPNIDDICLLYTSDAADE